MMAIKEKEIPKFLVSRRYISVVIAFIVLFSGLFLFIYQPFSLAVWFSTADSLSFSLSLLFYILSIIILVVSRMTMYYLQDRVDLTTMTYIWWIMFENIAISLLYTLITIKFFPVEGISTPTIATRALMCVTLILAIPNALVLFYAAYKAKCEELQATQYRLQRLSEEYRLLESNTQHELRAAAMVQSKTQPQQSQDATPRMINLYDNNGTLRLTLNIDSLYYLESEDNYIKVYYKHNDKIVSYMLRCRTRSVEESLAGTCMVRCHRSFIVNINKISVMEDDRRMHYLSLDDDSIRRIPVSKSYYESLVAKLNTIT
ncbi:MAG: LytTR family transcriptional regulator [Alistipes sp.]|nr:LytTR family transcriptional regulator [Alistipes sp.]MBO7243444.1 LytTR family transcriptional regulator [Alistipes sp.]